MSHYLAKSRRQRLAEREIPASYHIPISHFLSPSVFVTKDGALGAVIAVQGCPFELKSLDELHLDQQQIAKFLLLLGTKFAVYVVTHRRLHNVYPPGNFAPGFAQDFNCAYQKTFIDKPLFINDQYVVLITKNSVATQIVSKLPLWDRLRHRSVRYMYDRQIEKQHKQLKNLLTQSLQYLSTFSPRLLGEKVSDNHACCQSEVMAFLSIAINGKLLSFTYPREDVSTVLPLYQLFFGHNTLEWQGNTAQDRKFAAMLSIHCYGAKSASTALDDLLKVNFEYVNVHAYYPIDNRDALERIRKQGRHLSDTDDASITQRLELIEARDLVGSGLLSFGEHHNTVMVLADAVDELDDACSKVQKIYDSIEIKVIRESLNMESAFWAQIPGNFAYSRRKAMISSHNFADFCALHNYHHGYINQNHLGSALMLVESSSCTPLYVNFHKRGSGKKHDFTVGHTTITAPTGAGKTTLQLSLDTMSQKYGGIRIFFDRGRGMEIYIRAMGGFYSCMCPDQSTGLNPLTLPDTPANRAHLMVWLGSLLMKHKDDVLTACDEKYVDEVINRSYDTLPPQKRTLSVVTSFFPSDFSRLDNLAPWLRSADPNRPDGRLAWLFDNAIDTLDLQQSMAGFDMTHLLSHESEQVVFSIMLYLFHRLEGVIDGKTLVGIYLDEGWQLLKNDYWRAKIEEYLNSFRRKNTFLVFSTQIPSTVLDSPLCDHLVQGAATHIFLPNDKAQKEDYIDGFKLSTREYDIIKSTPGHERKFLIKQGNEAALGRLNLRGMEDYIAVLSANESTVQLLDRLRFEVGDDPADWMPLFQKRRLR